MQIFLHQLDGSQNLVEITESTQLQSFVNQNGLVNCRLVCQGENINSTQQLLALYENANVYVNADLDGGKGNVTQTRKTCPSCGPGIFMAQHWDRYYCGLCHTTIKMDAETIKKNEEIMKKKKAALEAERKAREKEAADKAPAGKGKKDAKKAGKKK